ncbi:hypothetical protein BLA23254_02732 [Burkholderia lata]|uniref:Uncharacterized protein n=1 Tax=Burkholderia lata (strain ATCC 17760 / DSM 23089 / LMG 22485 / NCIMB 9086 / R18194 / 383) TaxID=482957 RepID=A0A6P2KQI7_BURL3|nr:hypothetical protein BLA23254_02732 [Burkholderia lata]
MRWRFTGRHGDAAGGRVAPPVMFRDALRIASGARPPANPAYPRDASAPAATT